GDQAYACPRLADFCDQLLVARAVEDRHGEILDVHAANIRQCLQIVAWRAIKVDDVPTVGTHHDLLHIRARATLESTDGIVRDGDDGEGIRGTGRAGDGPVDRVDGDREPLAVAAAEALPLEERHAFLFLALADDDRGFHRDRAEGALDGTRRLD